MEGTHLITAKAIDNQGGVVISAPVNVIVKAPNHLPVVSITSPASNTTFRAPVSITINASAVDNDGTVSKVEFFDGSTKLGEDWTSPYSFSWSGITAGSHVLTAKATDNTGASTTSAAVNIRVKAPNKLPVVSIASPVNNASFKAPASITINVDAADTDGTVSKVEFFNGSTKVGESVTSPYAFTWNNVAEGDYSVTAEATDDEGAVSVSSQVNIVVKPMGPAVVSFTLVDAGTQKDIGPLTNGHIIDFDILGTKQLNIRANTNSSPAGSVVFHLDGIHENTDNSAPYAIKGNNGNGKLYNSWTPSVGSHTLTAIPYKAADGRGIEGFPLTVRFTVLEKGNKASRNARLNISEDEIATTTAIHAYPNPFLTELNIEFTLAESADQVKVELYDGKGSLVTPLFAGRVEANQVKTLIFRPTYHRSGLYIIKVTTGKSAFYKKITLLK
jgi:hypothetical protein